MARPRKDHSTNPTPSQAVSMDPSLMSELVAAKPSTPTEWLMQPFTEEPQQPTALIDSVQHAVSQLPELDKELVMLRFYDQRSYSNIGKQMGWSKSYAWRRTNRAVARLATIIMERTTNE